MQDPSYLILKITLKTTRLNNLNLLEERKKNPTMKEDRLNSGF